ncbi:MAG: hypothetical protein KA397_04020 [Paludibacteraceae bacterium]|nr:hypothetical protein [Paludibacteraceae bacterium]MBP6284118.1 hypothetical protein [Paludibacteraceae bacterium]
MKVAIYIGLSLALLTSQATVALSQSSVSRDVTLEREYNPTAIDAKKINTVPKIEEYTIDKKNITYTITSPPVELDKSFNPLEADSYKDTQAGEIKNGVLRVGVGSHWQILGDFYYPLLQGDSYLLDVNIGHQSAWGKLTIDDVKKRAMFNTTRAGFTFENQFRNSRLVSDVQFVRAGYDYYGKSSIDTSLLVSDDTRNIVSLAGDSMLELGSGNYTQVGTSFKLFTTNRQASFRHNSNLSYQYFTSQTALEEHNVNLATNLSGELENGRIGVALGVDNYFYSKPETVFANYLYNEDSFGNASVVKLSPYLLFEGEGWDISLGASLFTIIGATDRPVSGAANIVGKAALVPELFYLYGGIVGDIQHNSYSSIMKENKYISPDISLLDTYTPMNAYAGLKLKVMDGLLFDACLGYKIIRDQYFFVNRTVNYLAPVPITGETSSYLNTFDVVTEQDASLLSVDLNLLFDKIEGIDVVLNSRFNKWNVSQNEFAWHQPRWEIGVQGSYQINEQWKAGIGYNFMGGRNALVDQNIIAMNDIHDVNASASYQILDWIHLFGSLRNVLNTNYDSYYGYKAFGINGMVGASITF